MILLDRAHHRRCERRDGQREAETKDDEPGEDPGEVRRARPDAGEQDQAHCHDERPDRHRDAGADALRQSSGAGREKQHEHRDRDGGGARLQGGVAEHGLQLDDDEEERDAQRRVHDEGRAVGPAELPRLEDVERDERRLHAHLDERERDERDEPDEAGEDHERRPAVGRALDQCEHDAGEAERRRAGADEVRPRARLGVVALGHVAHRHPQRDGGERDVDEEHETPGDGVDEPTAQERADRSGDPSQSRPCADRRAVVLGTEAGGDQREAAGNEHRAAHTLEGSRRDQCADARRKAAQHGRDGEPHEPDHEHAPPAVLVAERAAQQEQRAQRQQVAVERPLQTRQPAAEIVPDVGQRHVDDRRVEERDARAEDGGEDHPPPARRPELDELRGSGRTGRLRHEAAPRSRSRDSELMQ